MKRELKEESGCDQGTSTPTPGKCLLLFALLWPCPSQLPSSSGEVKDLPCVAFPWYSSAGVGSGLRELIGDKIETLDTPPSRQMAVEPRHSQP